MSNIFNQYLLLIPDCLILVKKDRYLCTQSLCQEQDETLIHYFYECNVTKGFWKAVLRRFKSTIWV